MYLTVLTRSILYPVQFIFFILINLFYKNDPATQNLSISNKQMFVHDLNRCLYMTLKNLAMDFKMTFKTRKKKTYSKVKKLFLFIS